MVFTDSDLRGRGGREKCKAGAFKDKSGRINKKAWNRVRVQAFIFNEEILDQSTKAISIEGRMVVQVARAHGSCGF